MLQRAPIGSVTPQTAILNTIFSGFFRSRDGHLVALLGRRLATNRRAEALVRLVVAEFAEGRVRNISYYIESMKDMGSATAIRRDIDALGVAGLLMVSEDEADRRQIEVWPTSRLVDAFNDILPTAGEWLFSGLSEIFVSKMSPS